MNTDSKGRLTSFHLFHDPIFNVDCWTMSSSSLGPAFYTQVYAPSVSQDLYQKAIRQAGVTKDEFAVARRSFAFWTILLASMFFAGLDGFVRFGFGFQDPDYFYEFGVFLPLLVFACCWCSQGTNRLLFVCSALCAVGKTTTNDLVKRKGMCGGALWPFYFILPLAPAIFFGIDGQYSLCVSLCLLYLSFLGILMGVLKIVLGYELGNLFLLEAINISVESGDTEVTDHLTKLFELIHEPTFFGDGCFGFFSYLPRKGGDTWPRGQSTALLMVNQVAARGRWKQLFTNTNFRDRFQAPHVCNVDFPRLGICKAINDSKTGILLVETYAASPSQKGQQTKFQVKMIPENSNVRVSVDGKESTTWKMLDPSTLELQTDIGEHSFEIFTGYHGPTGNPDQ